MAHYAYKCFCYDIDYEKFKFLCEQIKEENDGEFNADANYDGDYWYVAERWVRELIEELKTARQKIDKLKETIAARTTSLTREKYKNDVLEKKLAEKERIIEDMRLNKYDVDASF